MTFDTNVAIYALSDDEPKAVIAQNVIAESGFISVQVLNEAANVLFRKFRLPWDNVAPLLRRLRNASGSVLPITLETHEDGMRLARRYGLSSYDALLIAVGLSAGATSFYSEDLQHGLVIDNCMTIVNPFKAATP